MNIKVAAFTVSEKSINTLAWHCRRLLKESGGVLLVEYPSDRKTQEH